MQQMNLIKMSRLDGSQFTIQSKRKSSLNSYTANDMKSRFSRSLNNNNKQFQIQSSAVNQEEFSNVLKEMQEMKSSFFYMRDEYNK